MDNLLDMDLYNLIGVEPTATTKEIQRAFRKKSLVCHPDKNPNNPRAAELFIELKAALLLLTDTASRARYDKIVNAKLQSKLRAKEVDVKRQKLINDLEAREAAARNGPSLNDEQRFKANVDRVQRENLEQMQKELERMRQQVIEELKKDKNFINDENLCRVKIRWKEDKNDSTNIKYDHSTLSKILSKYGEIVAIVLSGKKGRAMVQFTNPDAAKMAAEIETGLPGNPLIMKGLWDGENPPKTSKNPEPSLPVFSGNCTSFTQPTTANFEDLVLGNLRKAQELKRQKEPSSSEKKPPDFSYFSSNVDK